MHDKMWARIKTLETKIVKPKIVKILSLISKLSMYFLKIEKKLEILTKTNIFHSIAPKGFADITT